MTYPARAVETRQLYDVTAAGEATDDVTDDADAADEATEEATPDA